MDGFATTSVGPATSCPQELPRTHGIGSTPHACKRLDMPASAFRGHAACRFIRISAARGIDSDWIGNHRQAGRRQPPPTIPL